MENNNEAKTETQFEIEERELKEKEKVIRQKWHKYSGYAILICKVLFVLFALSIFSLLTWKYIIVVNSKLLIGLECTVGFIIIFRLIRYYTYTKDKPNNEYKVETKRGELLLLIQDLDWDIHKYEQSSMYYFSQVRTFKHLTIFLAGISTIILGLQMKTIHIPFYDKTLNYEIFSKNMALVIGAIVTALTSYMTYWNLEKYWFTNKTIVNELRAVKDKTNKLCSKVEPTDGEGKKLFDAEVEKLFKDYHEVKERFLKYWEGALGDKSGQAAK